MSPTDPRRWSCSASEKFRWKSASWLFTWPGWDYWSWATLGHDSTCMGDCLGTNGTNGYRCFQETSGQCGSKKVVLGLIEPTTTQQWGWQCLTVRPRVGEENCYANLLCLLITVWTSWLETVLLDDASSLMLPHRSICPWSYKEVSSAHSKR